MNAIKNLLSAEEKLKTSMQELEEILANSKSEYLLQQENLKVQQEKLKTILKDLLFVDDNLKLAINFTYFGQKSGGQAKSIKKTQAVRENGKKGGRPSKKIILKVQKIKDTESYKIYFSDNSVAEILGTLEDVEKKYPHSRYKYATSCFD